MCLRHLRCQSPVVTPSPAVANQRLLQLNLAALVGYAGLALACQGLQGMESLLPGVWFPSGWMLAFALKAGFACLPGFWLGSTLVDALRVPGPFWQHAAIGGAICLAPIALLLATRWMRRPDPLARLRDFVGWMAATVLGLLLSLTVCAALRPGGPNVLEAFLQQFIGVLALGPFVLAVAAVATPPAGILRLQADLRRPGLWALVLALALNSVLLQRGVLAALSITPFTLTFLLLLLAAFRFPPVVVTALMLLSALLQSWLPSLGGDGLLQPADLLSRTVLARLFSGVLVLVLMVLVANQEQRRMRERLERQKARLSELVAARTRELTLANARLQELTLQDSLTGIANRRCFEQTLQAEWRRAQRQGTPLTVGLLDVDAFKAYNDHYGHPAGDQCLVRIAAALAAALPRSGELVARYGGEEFVVVLPGLHAEAAAAVGERLRRCVSALALPHAPGGAEGIVTLSIGMATAIPLAGMAADALLAAADAQLYAAKTGGRDRVCHSPVQRSL